MIVAVQVHANEGVHNICSICPICMMQSAPDSQQVHCSPLRNLLPKVSLLPMLV